MLRLALRNVFRHKGRSAMTLAAIVFGVAGLIVSGGFVHDMFAKLAESIVHSQSGHVQVAREGFFGAGARTPEKYLIAEAAPLAREAARLPHVVEVASRLHFSGLLTNGRSHFAIVGEGIEAGKEARLGTHLVIKAGRMLAAQDRFGLLVGEGAARALRLAPGDPVALVASSADGAMNTLDFEVVGIFQSFSKDYDARAVKVGLGAAQELLDTAGANVLVVSLDAMESTPAAVASLRARLGEAGLEVRAWHELNDFYPKTVALYDRQFGFLRLIILVMVLLSVANSVNMSLFERVGEFGTMRALGERSRSVLALVLVEGALLGLIGSVLGVLVGAGLALLASALGIPMPPPPNSNLAYVAQIQIVPAVLATAAATGFLATVLASLLPALRLARLPIAEALRQNV